MDERLMKNCVGKPVPEWDIAHRLPIDRPVGPDIQETGATFRMNSVYMDVIEPSFLEKQWFIAAAAMAFAAIGIGPYMYDPGDVITNCMAFIIAAGFAGLTWKLGRGLFLGLCRRPIRFHRGERKLYLIRKRRFFAKPGEGDVVWEVPWTKDSIFCLHREITTFGNVFHIRHYTLDERDNVARVFSIGREWMSEAEVKLLLAQWNYWCHYMNSGPADLPKPMLFHTEKETPRESFLFSLYGVGLRAPVLYRIIMMPFILVFTVMRIIANATCRDPIWPDAIEGISTVAPGDPYAEPREGTPVGWEQTVLAQRRGEYPDDPKGKVDNWQGEPNGAANADLWLQARPPRSFAEA
ncbi:hypothetical protein B0G57_10593 [Trinickia symbiotica]|uniref:DUF6708 domain-containing protein n=1 Tax=Trinickia symbiotica TaxID=863227 RepID=A0A2N7X0V8_9BURK|nr:DUF6708 domain-containing protein [Trinickia symbiotica]PMS35373.1 hypothetical protein C0Z20_17905 [Trinickia symbiotica]PPK45387.1 hypothetical protein B0G57_10593 [Trinickia symbiotica]